MGKFDGIAILSDMDGTLLEDQCLHPEQLRAVQYFADNGGFFCPATGRSVHFLQERFPELLMGTYSIVMNGTAIYESATDRLVWKCTLDEGAASRAIDLCRLFPEVDLVNVHLEREMLRIPAADISNLLQIDQPIFKLVLHTRTGASHKLAEYCRDFTDFQYTSSMDHLFEILSPQAGKGTCARQIRSLMGDRIRCMIGIGDYANDISLLQAVDIGVAVENPYQGLKAYARWIAPPIDQHPMAWLVRKIETELI